MPAWYKSIAMSGAPHNSYVPDYPSAICELQASKTLSGLNNENQVYMLFISILSLKSELLRIKLQLLVLLYFLKYVCYKIRSLK